MSSDKRVIGIVGVGPRGLSVLERLITYIIKKDITNKVKILLFDYRQDFGSGCHDQQTPKSFLVNTVASQMTMYFDDSLSEYGEVYKGETLYEWCKNRDIEDVAKTSYTPRYILGRYLNDFFNDQVGRMNKYNIEYIKIVDEVVDICPQKKKVETLKSTYKFDKIVICTGHDIRNQNYYDTPLDNKTFINTYDYKRLSLIPSNTNVAIKGMGLTAFDILTFLTIDRGGHYENISKNKLKYIPSGNEPKIFIYSRSGVFYSGRAYNPSPDYIYQPKYCSGQLNLDRI